MSAFELARTTLYADDREWMTGEVMLFARLHRVHVTPTCFLLARAVPFRTATGPDLADPTRSWPEEQCDAWQIWAAAGVTSEMLTFGAERREWIGFARRGRWRWHHRQRLCSTIGRLDSTLVLPPPGAGA